jgi:hypothetical protein
MKYFLHVGCGQKTKALTTKGFNNEAWREIRLDLDPSVNPDLVGSLTDLSMVADESIDGIFSSHNIEHLYPHEVPLALAELRRVLTPDGFMVITCPDLRSICQLVAEDKLEDPAYVSMAGPIAPIDMLYGHRASLAQGHLLMAHRGGFTQRTITSSLHAAGFPRVAGMTRSTPPFFDIWVLALKKEASQAEMTDLVLAHFPQKSM